jgi:hypothetical protein
MLMLISAIALNPVLSMKLMWRKFVYHSTGLSANTNYDVHGHVGLSMGYKARSL